jgi:hypothetical protein
MSLEDTERSACCAYWGLVVAVATLRCAPKRPSRLYSKRAAAARLGITRRRLEALLYLCLVRRVRVGKRVFVFL